MRGPAAYVAAFGKHPGWNDHIDDLGLETPRLVEVKRRLYVEGIGSCIDSGAWDRLEPAQQIEGFAHVFLWRRPGDIVLGRLWSSQDGKGRAKYPMIVCAELTGVPLEWALEHALPRLEELEAQCKSTGDAAAVRSALDGARATLRGRLSRQPPSGPELKVSGRVWAELADCPAMGPERVGLHRLLYQAERELADYRPEGGATRTRAVAVTPQHMRVPACAASPGEELSLWARAMLSHLSAGTELGVWAPTSRGWVDVVVGTPDGPQFLFLRASPKAVPLVTDIPYDLDPAFVARATALVASGSEAPVREIEASSSSAEVRPGLFSRLTGWARGRSGLILGVVGGAAAILAGVGLMARNWGAAPVAAIRPPDVRPAVPAGTSPTTPTDWDSGPWRELVGMHRAWLGTFLRRLDEPPSTAPPGTAFKTRRELYATDPALAALLGQVDAARAAGPLEPLALAGLTRGDLFSLEQSPPEGVRANAAGVRRALAPARAIRDALTESWPVLGDLRAAATGWAATGWNDAAAELAALADAVPPGAGKDAAGAVDAALAAHASVLQITAAVARVSGSTERFVNTRDPVLASFTGFAMASIGGVSTTPRLPGMRAAALRVSALHARLDAFVMGSWEAVDHEAFAGSRVRTAFTGTPTTETYESWLFEVKDYPSLDPSLSPLKTWRAPSRLTEIDGLRKTLAADFQDEGEPGDAAKVASLREWSARLAATPWNRTNQAAVIDGAREIDSHVDALWEATRARLDRARAQRVGSAKEARDRLAAQENVVPSSPALSAAWAGWRDRLVADTPDAEYPRMLAAAQELEDALTDFSRASPAEFPGEGDATPWSSALSAASAAQRESAVTTALAPLRSGVPTPDEVRRALGAAAIGREAWVREADALAADLRLVDSRLRGAYSIDEPAEGGTLGEAAARAAGSPVLRDAKLAAAVRPTLARVDAVRRAASGDAAARVALVTDPGTDRATAVAAWRSLGDAPDWPATPAQLAMERDAARVVARIAGAIDDAGRGATIRAELDEASGERWTRCAARQRSAGEFELVAGAAADFGVTPEVIDDPRVRANLLLAQARARCAAGLADDEARALAASLTTPAPRSSPLYDELAVLGSGAEAPAPTIDVATLGPATAGWTGAAEGDSVRFTRGGLTIEFLRLEPEGGEPVYLATQETAVGVAAAVLAGTEPASRFASLTTGLERPGLRSWMVSPAGFSRTSTWIDFPSGTESAYAVVTASAPSDESPMLRLSPAAAVYLAHLIGCRLPTTAEWSTALAACGGVGEPGDWNLRDAQWSTWQAAAAGVAKASKTPQWPDVEIFWPGGFARGPVSGPAATPVHAGDDGLLLPGPAGSDPSHRFGHLVGNVAEFVLERPLTASAWNDPKAVVAAVRQQAGAMRVIGGSALSAPSVPLDEPQPIDEFDIEDGAGYSDVGFRLAFDAKGAAAPPLPVAARIVRLIDRYGYAPPE